MLDVSIVVKDHPSLSVLSVSLLLDVATSSRHLLMRETEKREIERERERGSLARDCVSLLLFIKL